MKRNFLSVLILLLLCCTAFAAGKKERKSVKTVGESYLDENFATYHALQNEIRQYAELGYQEFKSAKAHIDHLKSHGFTVEEGVAGMPTAFVASYGSGKPVIGILLEYDALPGFSQDTLPYASPDPANTSGNGHACGHNVLGVAGTAAAVAISKWLAEGHEGTVKVFGCPAEEGGGGKIYLVKDNCFDGVDAAMTWHPYAANGVNTHRGLANVQMTFTFHGITAHASAAPEAGRSALDAVEAFDYMINLMREHVPYDSRIHYVITDGGSAPNVVPDRAQVVYYFRNPSRKVVEDLKQRAIKAAEGAAMGTGTTMEYEILSGNYEKLYNRTLAQLAQKNLEKVGGVVYDEREEAFAREMMKNSGVKDIDRALRQVSAIAPLVEPVSEQGGASSDVGNVSWVTPVVEVIAAAFVPAGGGHCWQQISSAGTTIGTKGMMNASKTFYLTALDLYMNPELVKQAWEELEQRRGPDFKFVPLTGERKPPLDYRK